MGASQGERAIEAGNAMARDGDGQTKGSFTPPNIDRGTAERERSTVPELHVH